MTTTTDQDRDRAENEAAGWLIRLSEAPDDPALRAGFQAWLDESGQNAEIWTRTARAYHLVGQAPPRHRPDWAPYVASRSAAPGPVTGRRGVRRPHIPSRRLAAGLAAAAFAACLALSVVPHLALQLRSDFLTNTGELRTAVLDDGTRVHMAADSAIALEFGSGQRRVRLLRGEAFFEVTPDASRPFTVSAGSVTATVLGTGFEVARRDNRVSVAVRHGRVRVDDAEISPPLSGELRAGDWVGVDGSDGAARGRRAPEDIAAWRQGELVARDRPVGEIVAALRHYYGGAILMRAEDFAARRVSGIYSLRDPARTLRELAASHGATVRRITPWLLVVTE